MASRIQIRRDTAANWTAANPILAEGEFGVEIGPTPADNQLKIGDGATPWVGLDYFTGTGFDPESLSELARTGKWEDIQDRPAFANVATTGQYAHLTGLPTIPSTPGDVGADPAGTAQGVADSLTPLIEARETPAGAQAKVDALDADLAPVAKTGSYNDLTDTPAAPGSPEWGDIGGDLTDQADLTGALDAKADDADLAPVAKTGSYNDLTDTPAAPGAPEWGDIGGTLADQADLADALGDKADTASLAPVASTGDYGDLNGTPTLGTAASADTDDFATAAQGQTADSAVQPGDLSTVATTGSYNDLTDTPVAPGAPEWGDIGGTLSDQADLSGALGAKTDDADLSPVAKTGDYGDLTGTPTIPSTPQEVGADPAGTAAGLVGGLAPVAQTGDYSDLTNTPPPLDDASDISVDPAAWEGEADNVQDGLGEIVTSFATTLSDLDDVAWSGDYGDLGNTPTLGTAAAENVGAFATAAQGALADNAAPSTRTVNGQPLSADVELGPSDVNADAAGSAAYVSDLLNARIDALPDEFVPRPGGVANLPAFSIIAHRGGAGVAPENTLEAMRISAAAGSHALEMDVKVLGDGSIGLMHDNTVDRTTNGTGPAEGFTALSWQGLDAAHGFEWPGGSVRPPLLAQVLAEFAGDQVLVIEPKDAAAVPGIVALLDRYSLRGQCVIQATSTTVLAAIKSAGYLAYFYWASEPTTATINSVLNHSSGGPDFIGGDGNSFSDSKVTDLVNTGRPVWMWTINRRWKMDALVGLGVQGVMTDQPTYLAQSTAIRTVSSWDFGTVGYGFNRWPTGMAYAVESDGTLSLPGPSTTACIIGEVSPMAGDTVTIDVEASFDTVTGSQGALFIKTADDDRNYSVTAGQADQMGNGWMAYLRQNGGFTLFKHDAPATETSVSGTLSSSVLTDGLWVPLRLVITPTEVTATRVDTGTTYTATDATNRGKYLMIGKKGTQNPARFRNLVIT